MSIGKIQEKCAICASYLFEDDDVVYCPECGAPHHRDCYNSVGHCGFEKLHGTELQYKKPESSKETDEAPPVIENEPKADSFEKPFQQFSPFGFAAPVDADFELDKDITAGEAQEFVLQNTHRYIPKFINFKFGRKASWNWLAFLTPCGWLLSRKMYLWGTIIGALQVAFSMLLLPFNKAISFVDLSSATNYVEQSNLIMENIDKIGIIVVLVALMGTMLDLTLRVLIGVFGDLIYKNHAFSTIRSIKEDKDCDKKITTLKKGGVNIYLGLLGHLVVNNLPTIIATLTGML
ncbi:MAG: RING finger protein [Clostridia bacterium]|nr:RING finger protein [Clostridia bacterium]